MSHCCVGAVCVQVVPSAPKWYSVAFAKVQVGGSYFARWLKTISTGRFARSYWISVTLTSDCVDDS